jgi:hypothetical protein
MASINSTEVNRSETKVSLPNATRIFQRRGGHIEALPVPIFRIIQEHLIESHYRNLMNSNLAIFEPIKFETVHYSLFAPETPRNYRRLAVSNQTVLNKAGWSTATETQALHILNSVSDKSKQISIRFTGTTEQQVLKYSHLFAGIKKLTVQGWNSYLDINSPFSPAFPFSVFNDVRHLELNGIKGIPSANLDFENMISLKIRSCKFEEITAWNSNKSLKELVLEGVEGLKSFPSLQDIPLVTMEVNWMVEPASKLLHLLAQPSFLQNVQRLKLTVVFPGNFSDFSFCEKIPVIEFSHDRFKYLPGRNLRFPLVFNFFEISLQGFSLSSWNQQLIRNIKKCRLEKCSELVDFPEMPELELLVIQDCGQLAGLPPLLSLTKLTISQCPKICCLPVFPRLRDVSVSSCHRFDDVSPLSHVKSVTISSCSRVRDISSLGSVRVLTVSHCPELVRLHRSQSPSDDFMSERTTVRFCSLFVSSFTFCENIFRLTLHQLPNLTSLQEIGNIHHLVIQNCSNLTTTKGIGKISGSLILSQCASLITLHGLQGIPEVSIKNCDRIRDCSGLGNHHSLTVVGVSALEVLYQNYLQEGQKQPQSELFRGIEHLKFQPSKNNGEPNEIWEFLMR